MKTTVVWSAMVLAIVLLPLTGCKQPEQRITDATGPEPPVEDVEAAKPDEATEPAADAGAEDAATEVAEIVTPAEIYGFAAYVPDMTVKQGEILKVPVRLTYAHNAAGFQMTVKYDKKKLQVGGGEAVIKGSAVPDGVGFVPNATQPGLVRVACAGNEAFDTEKEELFVIHFKAIGQPGTTTVSIDASDRAPTKFEFANVKGKPLKPGPTAVDGTITIQ